MVVIFIAFSLFSAIAVRIFTDYIINQRVSEQQRNLNSISVSLSPYLKEYDSDTMNEILLENSRLYGGRFLVLNQNGVVLMDSFSMLLGQRMELPEVYDVMFEDMDASYGFHRIETESEGRIWSVNYTSAITSEYETIGILVYAESIQDIVDRGQDMTATLALITLMIALLIVLVSLMLSGYITKPIKTLQVVASRIANGELHQRVETIGNNEISRLGETFNEMSERLESMDAMKSEFVSNASHELKTPLSSMKILAQSLIYDEKADKKVYREFLTDINSEMDRLNDIISDLLLLTKIENDDRALNLETMSFSELVNKVVNSLRPIARAKKIRLKLQTSDEIELLGDELKLRIAIVNLIENAIKYTDDKGKVDVRVFRTADNANMEVKDTGVGIPKSEQVKIFERFYRVDKARARNTGGTGLGLHISDRVVRLHGGTISVKSANGKGATFTLTIPIRN